MTNEPSEPPPRRRPDSVPISVEIIDETGRLTQDQLSWLTLHITKALHALATTGDVRLRVVHDDTMAAAHEEFLGVPGTTDVITFDLRDPEEGDVGAAFNQEELPGRSEKDCILIVLDTDLLVCFDEAVRQSADSKGSGDAAGGGGVYPVERELLLYVVHGVLHCLGMDDHDEASAARMHRMEDLVLTAIGVGPVFARPGDEA